MVKRRTIKEILHLTTQHFLKACLPQPRLEAEVLLAHVLRCSRVNLYVRFDQPLQEEELEAMRRSIRRRQNGEPLAYIVGEKEFMSLSFQVDPRVLIPRPETEHLVEGALERMDGQGPVQALDVGTGSGAVAIALAYYGEGWHIVATDVEGSALEVARSNARRHGLEERIRFYEGDLFEALPPEEISFHCILSNPPYIPSEDLPSLQKEVRLQPHRALDGGIDGLQVYPLLIRGAHERLEDGGLLGLEVGIGQSGKVADLMERAGFSGLEICKDYSEHQRCIFGRRGKETM